MWAVMFLLMSLAVHVVIESAVQLVFAQRSGVWTYLSEFREKAKQAGLSLDQYAQKVGLDPYLGWGKEEVRRHELPPLVDKAATVLFVGDSVTAGHDVIAGKEDYPALLADQWGKRGIEVVNLAARGYGVDQMWLKVLLQAGGYHPNVIVFAYIPHDLIRPASDFNFGLPKPKFQFSGSHVALNLADGMAEFQRSYDSSRSGFHLSWWFISRYWDNKEYYVPKLFLGYYEDLFQQLGEGLAQLSKESKIPIIVVKLTNFRHFRGFEELSHLAASSLVQSRNVNGSDVRYMDMDECVPAKAKTLGLELEKEYAHHPSPVGHKLFAECLSSFMEPIVFKPVSAQSP